MLGPVDPLPCRPYRVLVAGTSGGGKTTTAARIAAILGIPHVEIDALFHGSDWTPRPSFDSDVRAFSAGPAWTTEWQYSAVRAHLADRADLLVWLDLPRWLVMRQVIRRTIVRRMRRQELWNGNREPALWTILTDRDHIVRWAWNTHHKGHARVAHLMQQRPDLCVVRLRNRKQVGRWLSGPLQASVTAHPDS
jgi:adenylate kinase family enzyme